MRAISLTMKRSHTIVVIHGEKVTAGFLSLVHPKNIGRAAFSLAGGSPTKNSLSHVFWLISTCH
jgi:hypothetical protein